MELLYYKQLCSDFRALLTSFIYFSDFGLKTTSERQNFFSWKIVIPTGQNSYIIILEVLPKEMSAWDGPTASAWNWGIPEAQEISDLQALRWMMDGAQGLRETLRGMVP